MDKRAETEFLLRCLSNKIEGIEITVFEQLSMSDWDGIIKQSFRHKVAPLLYDRLKKIDMLDQLPDEVIKRLRRGYLANAESNIRKYHEISKLFRIFEDEGIPVMVLKGIPLAELIYQNIALRPMSDVDLSIKSEDAQRVDEILLKLGYKQEMPLSKRHRQWAPINYSNKTIRIDAKAGRPSDFTFSDPWERASVVSIASSNIFILGPADFLLHLCLHLYRHFREGWTYLIWWCDITAILQYYRKEIDWNYLIRVVKKNCLEERIGLVLHLINDWSDGHIPADVLSQIRRDNIGISINDVLNSNGHLASSQEEEQLKAHQIQGRELYLFLSSISRIPKISNKIYHIFRSFFPSKEFIIHNYSVKRRNLVYFYYVLRIGDVIKKIVKSIFQLKSYLRSRRKIGKKGV